MSNNTTNDLTSVIKENKTKFEKFNNIRLQNFRSSIIKPEINTLLDAIPLLISINNPEIPGFTEGIEEIGFRNYHPTGQALSFIGSLFPSSTVPSFKRFKPVIDMFAIIGSAGSIAYNVESDIDFWICLDEDSLGVEVIVKLKEKLRKIEFWIMERYGVETHFYLNDNVKIKNDIFDSDENDISGQALGMLLKDEFYRSSIILNGKIPFWWVVPSGDDALYNKYLETIQSSELYNDFIDYGNLFSINKEEFLGAGLFQILKSIGNPFKSIIKIGILESYILNDTDASPFLCNIIKENVHNQKLEMDDIDPYVIMFDHVHNYYVQLNQDPKDNSLDILRMCFYIKIDPRLSGFITLQGDKFLKMQSSGGSTSLSSGNNMPDKIQKMIEYTKKWKWPESKLLDIDNFKEWDITKISKMWNSITKQVLRSYKRILNGIGSNVTKRFFDEEIKYITRRISSSLTFTANRIRPAISFQDNPIEKFLFIESASQTDGSISWFLSRGFAGKQKKRLIVHKEPSLIALMTWITISRMYQEDYTRVEIKSRYHLIEQSFVRELLNDLSTHFSIRKVRIRNRYFLLDSFPLLNFIIINLYSKYPKGIEDIIYLYHNSWGETVYEKYEKEIDFCQILTKLLTGVVRHREHHDDCVFITSPYPYKASKSFRDVQFLVQDSYSFFHEEHTEERYEKKYVTIVANNYVVFSYRKIKEDATVTCTLYDSENKLLYALSNVVGIRVIYRINPNIPELNYIRTIVNNKKDNKIQIYYHQERKYTSFYICDELGAIIFYRKQTQIFIDVLTRLYLFTKNVIKVIKETNPESVFKDEANAVELYIIKKDVNNECSITKINPELDERIVRQQKQVFAFKLHIGILSNKEMSYQFSLSSGKMSKLYSKSNVHLMLQEITQIMAQFKGCNYILTDIDLSKVNLAIYRNFSSFSFTTKNRFELLMDNLLNRR